MKEIQPWKSIKNYRQLLPVLLLALYSIDTIRTAIKGTIEFEGQIGTFELMPQHFFAFGAICLNISVYFFRRPFYKYTLLFTIALGLGNLLVFSAFKTTGSVSFNSLSVSFQPAAFFAGFLGYVLNFKKVNSFLVRKVFSIQTPEERENNEKIQLEAGIEKFKQKFRDYSSEKLMEIINDKSYVPAAIEAANEILATRTSASQK